MKIKSLISTVTLVAAMSSVAPVANAVDWSASVDVNSNYVFRGASFGAESIQAGIEGAAGDFYFGAWTSAGFGEESNFNGDELDLYAGYGFSLSDTISADVGATLYHFPQAGDLLDIGDGDDDASNLEIFGGLAFDNALAPAIYAYYDTTFEIFSLEASAGYSFPVSEMVSFDLSGALGSVNPDEGDDYTYFTAGAALSYAVSDDSSFYVGINGSTASEDNFTDWGQLTTATNLLTGTLTDIEIPDDLDLEDEGEVSDFLEDYLGDLDQDALISAADVVYNGAAVDDSEFWVGAGFSTSF